MPKQSRAYSVRILDLPKLPPRDPFHAVVIRQALIHEGVVRSEQLESIAIFPN